MTVIRRAASVGISLYSHGMSCLDRSIATRAARVAADGDQEMMRVWSKSMKNLKWIGLGLIGTGMALLLGSCGIWGTVGAALVGWAVLNGLNTSA